MRVRTILICCISAALAAGCGATRGRGLQVVASTNVYGDIARQIAGPSAHVTSILSDPNADPHLFEARTSNGLAVARAKVVIANGLGCDAFASTEPVPDYLVAAAGLRELSPSAFTRAVADGTEPAPGALAGMLRLVRERRIRVLLYNTQAVSPITKRV